MSDIKGCIPRAIEALENHWFSDCGEYNNDDVIQATKDLKALRDAIPIADQLSISLEVVGKDKNLFANSRWHERYIWNAAQLLSQAIGEDDEAIKDD